MLKEKKIFFLLQDHVTGTIVLMKTFDMAEQRITSCCNSLVDHLKNMCFCLRSCWRSDRRKRTRVMPHIKTYTRLNKSQSAAQFFLLTSANISKAAWGTLQKQNTQLFIRSYEAGVLLLPKFLVSICLEVFI